MPTRTLVSVAIPGPTILVNDIGGFLNIYEGYAMRTMPEPPLPPFAPGYEGAPDGSSGTFYFAGGGGGRYPSVL